MDGGEAEPLNQSHFSGILKEPKEPAEDAGIPEGREQWRELEGDGGTASGYAEAVQRRQTAPDQRRGIDGAGECFRPAQEP